MVLGFKSISNEIRLNDRIFEKESEYTFNLNSNLYLDKEPKNIDNIVVYNFKKYYKKFLENSGNKISVLTISSVLQTKYLRQYLIISKNNI